MDPNHDFSPAGKPSHYELSFKIFDAISQRLKIFDAISQRHQLRSCEVYQEYAAISNIKKTLILEFFLYLYSFSYEYVLRKILT